MIEVFGDISPDIIRAGKLSDEWFTRDGECLEQIERKIMKNSSARSILCLKCLGALRIETTYYPIALGTVLERHIEKRDVPHATAFLETLLKVRPEDRAWPEDILDHPWFSD